MVQVGDLVMARVIRMDPGHSAYLLWADSIGRYAILPHQSDVNGDGATDASDISVIDNNQALFLFYARPY